MPISFQARAFADLSDIERIEVLRGPQSTLYGKSASAGLINIVTPPPSDKLTVKLGAFGTTDSEYGANAVVSGPMTENLGFRSAVNYDKFDGNVRNLFNDQMVNGRRIFSTRNKLSWDPTSNLNVTVGVDYIDGTTTIGRPFPRLDPNALLRGTPGLTPAVYAPGVTPSLDNTDVVNNFTSGTQYHDFAQSLKVSLDLGGPTLMSITSHDKLHPARSARPGRIRDHLARQPPDRDVHGRRRSPRNSAWSRRDMTASATRSGCSTPMSIIRATFVRGPVFSLANWYATEKSKSYAGFGQLE